MKKRLNSSILAATSLTAITVQHQAEASTLVLTEAQLSTLSPSNQLESSDVTTLDFSNLTPEIVNSLKLVPIDLSKFQNVRNIIWPWFASNLKITLPVNFNTPQNDTYSRLTIIGAGVAPSSDSDFTLNLESLLSQSGKIILDTKAVPVTELKTGSAVAKIERNVATTAITVPDTIEAIDTDGVIPNDVKTSVTLVPSVANPTDKVPFVGLPVAVIGTNASSLNISAYSVAGQDVAVSGMPNLTTLITAAGDNIGSLKVTGETTVTTNAASINKVEFTSTAPDQTVVTTMSSTATTVAPTAKESHLASFAGKTELDFSKLDLGTTDATASRIKDIFDGPVPITSIVSMKIGSSVLAAVMAKLSITSLSSFSALKRLDIISATGAYQPTTLASSDLPSSLEEFYSSTLVVRKGTLSADLEFDSKFSAATLDLNGLNINGKNLTIAGSFTANSVNTLKLNPSLLAASATKNLISASSSKSIIVSGAASGALTTTHLQNVGTIDLRTVTGATSFSAPLDVDGNNSNLNKLYLPSAFDVEAAADILSGVDNGEVTVYISGAYSGAKTLDASYDKTILNFSGVTGTGRFQLPAGVRGLVLSDAVKGINVGAAAVVNNFDFSGLTRLRQITDLPTSATVLKLSNSSASSALELNLAALTSLTTLSLGSSKVSQLSLPATATLTNGGGIEHLDLSSVTDLAVLNGLNALLAAGSIKQVSFPTNPASALHINLVDTITGITFNNLDKVPTVTLDSDYSLGNGLSNNMWPTVKSKLEKADWSHFFKYIIAPVDQGGINSPSVFDLSGQAIESQAQATAFIAALNELSQSGKQLIQKIIIRIDAATTGAIDLSAIVPTDFTHNSLKIIIDQSTGSAATVTVSSEWTSKTKTYVSLDQVSKTTTASWTNYLNYRFGSLNDKGQGATSLDLSWIDLSAAEWTALMTTLNTFSSANVIETMHLKLVAANNYSSAPAFTTATLSAAKSIIVDVTGVKNSGAQVTVTGLPSATVSLQVEQRVTDASAVNRTTASSWKGYLEHLLSNISGTNYTLDLTASAVNIDVDTQLTALNSALAGLSAESKLKIKNINLKIAPGEREANFTVSTNFTGFTNLASLVVDATGALNSPNQSAITFSLTNAPTYAKAHVTSLDSVIKNSAASWEYYFAHRLATDGVLLTNLDVSAISLSSQADLTAFLTALHGQSTNDKSSVQSIKLKLASTYTNSSVDFSVSVGSGQISGLTHASFAVEVDRNGANNTAPVTFTFGTAITANKTTIKDTAFTSLGSFDGANAHHWLGYVRALLAPITSGTTTLDLSAHSILEMNNAKVAKFITAMNALPTTDKAKIATLKVKLASGDFGAATADLSGLSGFTNLTALVVDRNGARTSATLYNPAVSITGSGTVTVNDPELGTVSSTGETNKWLGYLRFVLNGMSGVANTLDVSAFAIDSANAATAFNNAFQALPASEKLKVQTLKLAASAVVTLGTSVTGFTNLTKVIVDQTAAPTVAITITTGFGTTQKTYVTSASTAQTNNAWAKYIDYAMSSVANGGLNQTTFDLTGLTLDSTQVSAFLAGFTIGQKAAVTAITLKLNSTFGAASLAIDGSGFNSTATAFTVHRNGAVNGSPAIPVAISLTSPTGASSISIIDPTAGTVADQTKAQDWLKYLTGVLNDAASSYVLDLRSKNLSLVSHVTAFNAALNALDSALKAKVDQLWLTVSATDGSATLGTGVSGFTLTKVIVDQTAASTADFEIANGFGTTQKTYVTSPLANHTNTAWAKYIDYAMSSVANGGLNQTTFDLTGLTLDSTQVGQFFTALDAHASVASVTAITLKLASNFGASTLDLSSYTGLTSLADDGVIIHRNAAAHSSTPVTVSYGGSFTDAKVKIIDPTATTVADQTKAQDWLKYLNGILTDAASSYVLDLRSKNLSLVSHVTAFNAALTALDTSLKSKVDQLWLTVSATDGSATLGTGVSGFTLTKVIVDQTAASTADLEIANGFGTTQKTYVTSALANHTNTAWAKYIDYAMSSTVNGGLNQTAFDLTGLTLTNAQVGQFLTALDAHASAASVTAITLKLASTFGAASLDLSSYTGLTGLIDDGVIIYRNSAAHSNAPVTVTYGGSGASFVDDKVKLIDPTATTVTDKTKVQDWLKYLSYVTSQSMFDATSGLGAQNSVLDLSSLPLAVTSEAPALISALILLDSSLKAKLKAIHIKFATGDLGGGAITLSGDLSSSAGFTNLTKFIVDVTETYENASATQKIVDFTGLSVDGSKDMWVTKLSSVDYISTNAPASWLAYINYKIRNNDADLVIDTSALNSDGITVTEAGYLFNALENLSTSTNLNKHRLIAVGIKLDTLDLDGGAATLTVNQDLSSLSGLLALLVNTTEARYAGAQVAVDFSGGTFHANTQLKLALVYKLSAVDKGSINSWKYLFNTSTDIGDQNFWKYYFNVDAMTSVDVSSTTLTSAEATAFFTALNAYSGAGNINTISLKLDPTFGAASLDLSSYTGFTSLANDGVVIYRNGSSTDGNSAPITITYGGSGASFVDDKVKIIDPTATTVTDTASAQQWLGYLTGVLNDAASEVTLDLSSIAIDDAEAVTAFNAALNALDSALRNKITLFKLTVTHTADITLGTGTHGFDGLTRIEFTKPATNTVTFADALSGKRTYLTSFDSVKMNTAADWTRYLNYMLSTTAGGQSASSLNLNSLTFANQTAVDAFFAGLNTLSGSGVYGNKSALTTLRMKLADGQSAISIGRINNTPTAATGLAAGLHVIVDPGTSTGTTPAGSAANTVQADNLIVLDSVAAFSKDHIAYLAEQPSFAGTIDLTALNYTNTTDVVAALNLLSADIKAKIKTINLKLQSGTFGSLSLTLGALTGFTDVTFNIDRNGAIDGVNTYGSLVTITNSTTHTVNLTDAEFHNMSTFDKTSSANWIGYLTHELNSAPENYTLDLTINAALYLDSTSSVGAFSNALRYLPDNLKTRVALLKVRSSTNGDFGATDWNGPGATERVIPEYAAFDHLNSIVIEYTATGLAMGAYIGHLTNTNKYAYITTPFDGMDWNDWTKYVDYQLNAANLGGLTKTSISLDKHLSSSELSAVLTGLDAAAGKASLVNLTLNLASSITGDINVGASGLTNLASVIINTNGSAARLTPSDEFYNKTAWTSVLNVNPAVQESWRAYLKGQSSIAAIDIREIELADQDQLTAFLTALNAEDRKANIATIKIKLASSYTGTVSFATVNTTGLTALTANNSVEIHRNGSAATAVQGGNITDAKIKLVDLTASSLTNRSNADSWRRYLTTLIEATPGAIDLSLDSDTYLRSNAHVTAFMTALQNLSPANKLLVTSLKLELAPGAAWTNITALGQGLTGFTNLTSFIVDATDATVSGTQVTVAFHVDLTTASPKAIVSSLNSVDKDSQDSWTYFFNSAAMTTVNVSSTTLTSAEAGAFLAALGTGTTAKADITSLTLKLDSTFGAGSLSLNGSGLTGLQTVDAVSIQRNGAENAGSLVSVSLSNGLTSTHVRIVDQTITDADAVIKTSASSWLSYLTYALDGSVTELVLTDDNLVLGTQGQATALSSALDALDPSLKAKAVTLKVKAAADVTIGATLTTAGDFSALTVIELDKPAANTITISTKEATTQLHIADLEKVKRDSSADWLAYTQYLMKSLGVITNFDLDMTSNPLASGDVTAFITALQNLSPANKLKIQKVKLKLASGAWTGNVADLGQGTSGFDNLDTFTVDATNATVSGTQVTVTFHSDLSTASPKVFVTTLDSVDKDNDAAWTYYLNSLTKDGAAALDLSSITLSPTELTALDSGLDAFSTADNNEGLLSSIHIKVSGAAGAATVNLTADLNAQTAINSAAKFIVEISGFTHASSQAVVEHTGGTPKDIELRISGASDVYRNSAASWNLYLNYVKATNSNAMPTTLDLTSSSNLYLRSQADVNALMTAIQARSDKANITTLDVRLAPGSVGSDITFGIGVSDNFNPIMDITVTGATNNGSLLTTSDIHYAGSFTSTGKTLTQAFASTVLNLTVEAHWTSYLQYVLSSTADGGLGQVSIVPPALTSGALTALLNALNNLSAPLKTSIQHLHLDVSHASFNGGLTLGTGVSGLSNLQEVTYVRASNQADATAAASSSFENKLQRLRTAWNSDALTDAAAVGEYLRYVLMDTAMGGAELTTVDLTSQILDADKDGYVYTALGNLPSELISRTTELRLKLNTNSGGNYSNITLPNLTTVKYFQTGNAIFVAPTSTQTVTTTRFRASETNVTDKTAQAQWTNYIDYVMSSTANGGLNQTTFDLSSITLTSAQATAFLAALAAHTSKASITAITLKLDPTFGAASLDLSTYTGFTDLSADSVTIQRNAAVHANTPVTITYGVGAGKLTDANVKIIDPETHTTANKDNTRQEWLEYLTHTIHTTGLTSGLLTIEPSNAFSSQAETYRLFDAMEALDPSLKSAVNRIIIDISSIPSGKVYLMRTDDAALTGFTSLTNVIYKRAGVDTNVGSIVDDLNSALKANFALDAIPTWVRADNTERDNAINSALQEGNEVWSAIRAGNATELKSQLVTKLAQGVTFPTSDAFDDIVVDAAAAVEVTVDGDVKSTLETALTPFRSTGKIATIGSTLTTVFTNGSTTGLGTLSWLKTSWTGYANHTAFMTAVLADNDVTTAIETDGQTVADIKTAVTNYLDNFLLPYGTIAGGSAAGSLGKIIFDMNLSSLTNWNNGSSIETRNAFRDALENAIRGLLETAWSWFTPGTISNAVNEIFPAEDGYFPLPTTSGDWDATAIKQELFDRLKGIDNSNVIGFSAIKSSIPNMINGAFTAGNATLTTNTAAWVRPTVGIESYLTTSIEDALNAFPWYTGNAEEQALDAVAAGGVATNDAATIITNIQAWLTANVSFPTPESIFEAGVDEVLATINLEVVGATVTTDFGDDATLSRYRIAISDITDKENAGQWTEYLLHKLAPVSEGGLGATTIDVSSVDLGNDHVTHFWGALRDGIDDYRTSITSIKFALDNSGGDVTLDGGGKTYNDNLKIIVVMNNKATNTFTLGTDGAGFKNSSNADLPNSTIDHRITIDRTVSASATQWERWLNHKLSTTFGGVGATTIDLSSIEFTSQAQLNNFFAGLEAVDNKNLLASLTLKLASDNFGAASARIGYTGSAAVTNLKSDIAITVQRNGARNGAGLESTLVTINHSDIDALSSVDGATVDNTDAVDVDNLSSSAEWLEYLNSTLTAAGSTYTLDLTGSGLQLQVGSSATQATALFNALQALNPTLKAKIATIKIKLAAGDHGQNFTINPDLDDFTNLTSFIVDATGTLDSGGQYTVTFNTTNDPVSLVTKEARVTSLGDVDLDSAESWGYYLNHLNATNGNIKSIDLSDRGLAQVNEATTQVNLDAFFTAVNTRSDKATVQDIYLRINGLDNLTLNIGTGTTGLTALNSVVIRPHMGNGSTFTPVGNIAAADLAVINLSAGTLGSTGTTAEWKGYFAYLLENSAHGGGYTGSNPVALNLTTPALNVSSLAVLQAIETAIAELPTRLKARISAIVIKTTDANVTYTQGGYQFGDAFTTAILNDLNALKVVVIESCTTGTDPVFDTNGDFFNTTGISKIVYHTTLNIA